MKKENFNELKESLKNVKKFQDGKIGLKKEVNGPVHIKYKTGPSKIMHTETCITDCPYSQKAPDYPKINKVGSRVCRSCDYYNKEETIRFSDTVFCNYKLLQDINAAKN